MLKNLILKFISTIIILVFIISCISCDNILMSSGDKKRKKGYEEDAIVIAKEYINNKYNFVPEIKSAEAEFGFDSGLMNVVYLKMSHENKTFYTCIDLSNSEFNGDTYQNDIIKNDILNLLKSMFGEEPYYISTRLENNKDKSTNFYYHDLYDKSKLFEFFPPITAVYINNPNFNEENRLIIEEIDEKREKSDNILIYNFDSINSFKKIKKDLNSYYMKNIYTMEYFYSGNLFKVNLDNRNGIILENVNYETKEIKQISNYNIKKIDESSFADALKYHKKYRILLNSIDLTNLGVETVYVEKKYYKDYKKVSGVLTCIREGNVSTEAISSYEIGDYYYINFGNYCDEKYLTLIGDL